MSDAIENAKAEAARAISVTAAKMKDLSVFELLALIDAAYDTLANQEIEYEIQAQNNETATCPACGEVLKTIFEYEKAADTESESDVLAGRKLIIDEPMPNYSDHVAWVTPCCATRVSLSVEWSLDTKD